MASCYLIYLFMNIIYYDHRALELVFIIYSLFIWNNSYLLKWTSLKCLLEEFSGAICDNQLSRKIIFLIIDRISE